ncbi:hypothetical protein [Catellatospora sp. NPDC049133]|uniref:hypothetical protein n=1 Tax=Catellatospora sp. NPDC049133 TaxID=3155499 RepID=UPI00340C9699
MGDAMTEFMISLLAALVPDRAWLISGISAGQFVAYLAVEAIAAALLAAVLLRGPKTRADQPEDSMLIDRAVDRWTSKDWPEEALTISFDRIVALLDDEGVKAYVEQTGGGTATIYIGETVTIGGEEQYELAAGPGSFEGPGWTEGTSDTANFSISRDDHGVSGWYVEPQPLDDEEAIVRLILASLTRARAEIAAEQAAEAAGVRVPQVVGWDGWPVVSAIRIGDEARPAEFVVVVDCGDGRFGTMRVYVWPGSAPKARDGHYDLTLVEAHQDMLERAKMLPTYDIEAVVEAREPYEVDRTMVFVNGDVLPDVGATVPVRARVVVAYVGDLSDDLDMTGGPSSEELTGLSPAAAAHLMSLYPSQQAAA